MRYYLIGHNIKTSLSPQIHNLLFKLKNLPHQYQINKTDDPMPISQMN
jgi:shikimate 5-dehydrogenase